ncbi:hypothetical protein [Streptomyces sp. NPDC058953]|uniref:hypothetical protein n=1 Tax=unclassified Streptomyces TaxID=2593676 RepID=UPI0036BEBEB0
MRRENCGTRNHIEVCHDRVLPPAPERIPFRTVLRGSLLPLLLWGGVTVLAAVLFAPVAAAVPAGLFAVFGVIGFVLRRRAGHSVRCGVYGAVGGVLDKSTGGF